MNRTMKNIVKVALSNVATVISGVIVGFLLPKIIGVTNYGYYKTFSLYIAYISIFQFGITEGIYLKYGGVNFDDLQKNKFRYYSRFLISMQIIVSIILIIVSVIFLSGEYKFIFACVSVFILFQNITTYYQYISQITGRFNELSIRNLLKSLLTIISVASMWIYYHFNPQFLSYKIYTICYVAIYGILCIWYIGTYRDITFGAKEKTVGEESVLSLAKIGFPLLISNLCSTFIFTIDRQFVNIFFDIDSYGSYAFAYNMLSLVTVATSSIATVIYPTLMRTSHDNLKKMYPNLLFVFNFFVLLCIVIYYPLCEFVKFFFETQTKYIDSLPIFRVILPSLAVSCSITVILHNYFKTFKFNTQYFVIVICVLIVSIITNIIAYHCFKSMLSISIASVIVTIIWYIASVLFLKIKLKLKYLKNTIYMLLGVCCFYLTTFIENWILAFMSYLIIIIIISMLLYFRELKYLLKYRKIKLEE